jgi:ATP-binding cassette subfamily B protein
MKGAKNNINDALNLLNQPINRNSKDLNQKKFIFREKIDLRKVDFSYANSSRMTLENITLSIKKGEKIGIIGETASGKSTLLDIIMGLLRPSSGELFLDGCILISDDEYEAFQGGIAHVPQSIFLASTTIAENIALGEKKECISMERVIQAASQAHIIEDIERMNGGFNAKIGENGVNLSGGQRQRLGIARALYKRAEIIILDEATSALDARMEGAVMDAINKIDNDLTIIMVAHRITTLSSCDRIILMENGKIKTITSYQDLVKSN